MKFTEFLDQYGIPYQSAGGHRHVREGWVGIDCPYCGRGTHKFHMGFNLTYHNLTCWRCGPHRLMPTMVELTGFWPSRIKKELEGLETFKRIEIRHTGSYQPPKNLEPLTKNHRAYLHKRGFDCQELQQLWNIQSIGLNARLSWRLFIPIRFRGKEVSWTTRSTSATTSTRYLNASPSAESVPQKRLLYGWDYVRHSCILVEGPTDVWKIGPGAVACLGLQFSQAQVELLSRIPTRVICFDNEPIASRRAWALRDQLLPFEGDTINVQLDSPDPGSASNSEIRRLRMLL